MARKNNSIIIPPDKSITHRALIFAAIGDGKSIIENPLYSDDTLATISILRGLGVKIEQVGERLTIYGKGIHGLRPPKKKLCARNSGTTFRLMLGLLAGQKFNSQLTCGKQLQKRPMKRITEPLKKMGARISDDFFITGSSLSGINWKQTVPSAQVKSALMLASLYADGVSTFTEKIPTRDHTERMLSCFTSPIKIPGDVSSAAYFIVATLLSPKKEIVLKNIGINPTRMGIIHNLKKMGGQITIEKTGHYNNEPVGNIIIRYSQLKAIRVDKNDIPSMIDEIPLLALAAAQANGITIIDGLDELRHKESDRLSIVAIVLKKAGAKIEVNDNSLLIHGPSQFKSGRFSSYNDHRIAMMLGVLDHITGKKSRISHLHCVKKSFPDFFSQLFRYFSTYR